MAQESTGKMHPVTNIGQTLTPKSHQQHTGARVEYKKEDDVETHDL